MRARWEVLLLFAALEVVLFEASNTVKAAVAILEYGFVLWAFAREPRVGVSYFLAFTLLSVGAWSYVATTVQTPASFWGLRVGGFSFNAMLTLMLAAACLVRGVPVAEAFGRSAAVTFLTRSTAYALAVGSIAVATSINYPDDFRRDVIVGVLVVPYLYLVTRLSSDALGQLLRQCLAITVIGMLLSLFLGIRFEYGDGYSFVLMNAFSFIVFVAPFVMRRQFSTAGFLALVAGNVVLVSSGQAFLGGKALIVFVLALAWGALHSKRVAATVLALGLTLWIAGLSVLDEPMNRLGEDVVVLYKFVQIYDVFAIADWHTLSLTRTSMGNLIAEGRTILVYLTQNPGTMLFGNGFGAGVPDLFNYLTPLAGGGAGYSYEMVDRNQFTRMHLPVFEILLRTGVIGAAIYLLVAARMFLVSRGTGFLVCLLLIMVVTHSKEMLLLTVMFGVLDTQNAQRASQQAPVVADQAPGESGPLRPWLPGPSVSAG